MAERIPVAKVSEITPGQIKAVQLKGETVAVCNLNGTYYAIADTCPHAGGPLSEGELDGRTVTCPWHGAQFDVCSGEVLAPPAGTGVKHFAVHVEGDQISLEI